MFTLLHISWGLRQEIGSANPTKKAQVRDLLDLFQRAVAAMKRNADSEETGGLLESLSAIASMTRDEVHKIVEDYMSGIRNSSDLGSRRIRSQQLTLILSTVLKS
jgi:hypothetical protein